MKKNHLTGMMILLLMLLSNSVKLQTLTVSGHLLDFKHNSSPYALVGISASEQENASNFVNTGSAGEYTIKITKPGINFLMYSLPGHNAIRIPVLNDKTKEITIDVTLAPYEYTDNFDDVVVIGSFNNFNFGSAEKMAKRNDGTYFLEVKSGLPEMKYQLYKIVKTGRSVNGTGNTAFEPDSSGDYRSVIPVVNGKAVIEFDPGLLPAGKNELAVKFTNSAFSEKLFEYMTAFNKILKDVQAKMQAYAATNNKTIKGFSYDSGDYLVKLENEIRAAEGKEWLNYLKVMYIRLAQFYMKDFDSSKAAEFFKSLSPENEAWSFMPNAFFSYSRLIPKDEWKDLVEKFQNESSSETIKVNLIGAKLATAQFSGNEAELTRLRKILETDYTDNSSAKSLLKMFPSSVNIKIGAEIPDFEVKSIEDENTLYSKKNMLGKIYMIDFWATWCGPCVGEMESMHKAYEKFRDKGFQILSLSMDQSADDVVRFRNDKWKMPWLNTFLGMGDKTGTAKNFEVTGIPRPILVGADRKILALEADLRGNKLETTLEKYFK